MSLDALSVTLRHWIQTSLEDQLKSSVEDFKKSTSKKRDNFFRKEVARGPELLLSMHTVRISRDPCHSSRARERRTRYT